MKLHIITVGQPKLPYAKLGFETYLQRLKHTHTVRVTHLADKYATNADKFLDAARDTYTVALVIDGGRQFSSHELAKFLQNRELEAREVSLLIGGPDGLPSGVLQQANICWSFSKLTFPHDLAMVVLVEALYRASAISSGHPYHH